MQITIDGISETFENISQEKQQQAIAKAREILEKEAQQNQVNPEWKKQWKEAVGKIYGLWENRDIREFQTIRDEFNRGFSGSK